MSKIPYFKPFKLKKNKKEFSSNVISTKKFKYAHKILQAQKK